MQSRRPRGLTIAGSLYLLSGLSLPPRIAILWFTLSNDRLPMVAEIELGSGPIAQLGMGVMVAAQVATLLTATVDVSIGWGLLRSSKRAGVWALILAPIEVGLSIGSAAPIPLVVNIIKSTLVARNWPSLRNRAPATTRAERDRGGETQ